MPRSIVTGNGELLVGFDYKNLIEDLYFPYVGMEDQIAYQHHHRVGVYTDNQFSWLDHRDWSHHLEYVPDTLVTQSWSQSKHLGLKLSFNDFVYPTKNVFIRKITVENQEDHTRDIRLFFSQDFHLYGDKQQDTAFYEPEHKAVVHYRKSRYFWVSGMTSKEGVDSFTTGKSEYRGLEGTWRDAEDGHLHEHPIEQGSVDSTVQFNLKIPGNSHTTFYFWICAGKEMDDVEGLHRFILEESPEKLLKNTINYWKSWVHKERDLTTSLPEELKTAYKRSLLLIRTQIDNRGAILAANDSDIMKFNKDTYTYMWPRDGAWVALGLDHAGYGEISKRFFEFCADVVTDEGYLLHKYNPDRTVGSSWHPWYKDGKKQLPIQEDETALVLHALHRHFHYFGDLEFLQKMYDPLIRNCGNFLMDFVDENTGLPKPSYDLWEREWGIFAYTCATVYAGLTAAAHLSEYLGHFNHHRRYEKAAMGIKEAILKNLYDAEHGRFLKRLIIDSAGNPQKDYGLDASMHALWMMDVLPADDPRIVSTNEAIFEKLAVRTEVGGIARFENDDYMRVSDGYGDIPGNPWVITTLWDAQWKMALAKTKDDLKYVEDTLHWVMGHMNDAGVLPEQFNPFNGDHLSVAPLTWSHSTFIDTILTYNERLEELT